ncbi:MAG: hypothetical protein WAU78_16315 [Roseiarcus sp.]|jgi:hypothetical protein
MPGRKSSELVEVAKSGRGRCAPPTRSDRRDLDGRIGERLDALAARLDRFLGS